MGDSTRNGKLSMDEIQNGMAGITKAVRDKKFGHGMPEEIKDIVVSDGFVGLFDILDVDGSGTIGLEEFSEGVSYLALQSIPIETLETLHLLRLQSAKLEQIEVSLGRQSSDEQLHASGRPNGR